MRLALASAFTLGLLASFLFAAVGGLAIFYGAFNFYLIAGLVVLFNVLMWLISPKISDFTYSWFYDMQWIDLDELREISPESAKVIEQVTQEYDYKVPKMGVIHDSNPQAFTYGSGRWNSRIMVTEGLFEYLDDNEASSVYAHELGHITNRDFIVMTIANTVVQLLYMTAIRLYRAASDRNNKNGTALIGFAIITYIFYFVGRYLVYYLSRVREYYADKFAGEKTDPNYLSSALIKISYGIIDSPDNQDLMKATESMGVMNLKQGEEKGAVYHSMKGLESWDPLAKAFLFDIKNPWASLLELKSTHPLTGKRVEALCTQTDNPFMDFKQITNRIKVDTGRLYRQFFKDLAVIGLPGILLFILPFVYAAGILTDAVPEAHVAAAGLWISLFGAGSLLRTLYRYPISGEAQKTTVLGLLGDIYASPVRGTKAALEGEIIGKGNAGYIFGSDLQFRDDTGMLHLRYKSIIPVIGNFLFGWMKADDFIDTELEVKGWFLRGTTQWMALRKLGSEENSWPHIHSLITGSVIFLIGLSITLGSRTI